MTFNEVAGEKELSTIDSISSSDDHAHSREKGKTYEVRTISLRDMLLKYRAPRIIDYLSIDTEGSEFEILSSFNFDEYQFRVITCEHNHTPQRENILSLLSSRGYARKFEQHSLIDDWYVNANLL